MIYYHDHPEYRIGDEIQSIALLKYLLTKGHEIYYKDSNPFVSAIRLFPDNLVIFASDNLFNFDFFEPYNIWFWAPLMREKGIYTELNHEYDESKAEFDVVFTPVLNTGYNTNREIKPESAIATLNALTKRFKKVRMIVDARKKYLFPGIENPHIVYSDDIYETFEYIRQSHIFLGTDTGTSHYAGALKHPRMVLALPDETPIQNEVRWQRELIAERCNEPEILRMEVESIPCCDPKQYQLTLINNHEIQIDEIMKAIDRL